MTAADLTGLTSAHGRDPSDDPVMTAADSSGLTTGHAMTPAQVPPDGPAKASACLNGGAPGQAREPSADQAAAVAVAVSGGMDSLLALALARESGCEILALHAHFLPPDDRQKALARELAALCRTLGVPFEAVDLSDEFRRRVIEPFVQAYASGLTPNPCAGCNRDMKFGLLADKARELGAQALATGHYACSRTPWSDLFAHSGRPETTENHLRARSRAAKASPERDGRSPASSDPGPHAAWAGSGHQADLSPPALRRGQDPAKDQSYFLCLVPAQALARAIFPLGGWRKAEVPAALAARGLAPPLPSESQEVCFIPGDDYRAFLQAQDRPLSGPGPIALEDGRVIGRHEGLWRYTIGQRKGIGLAWSEPLYVLDKRPADNALVVGPRHGLDSQECRVRGVNLLADPAAWPRVVLARTCYRQTPRTATVVHEDGAPGSDGPELVLRFASPVPRPTPGQVACLYDDHGRVLAGGIIA